MESLKLITFSILEPLFKQKQRDTDLLLSVSTKHVYASFDIILSTDDGS